MGSLQFPQQSTSSAAAFTPTNLGDGAAALERMKSCQNTSYSIPSSRSIFRKIGDSCRSSFEWGPIAVCSLQLQWGCSLIIRKVNYAYGSQLRLPGPTHKIPWTARLERGNFGMEPSKEVGKAKLA